MRVPRKDPNLNDSIEVLQEHYVRCQQNVAQSWATLDKDARAFVETEIERCLDLRYYLENYHFITTEQGVQKSLYPFWDHQEIVYEAMQEEWAANGYCKIIILKPRQTGISVWTAAAMFHRTITTPHCFTMIIAQNDVTSAHIYKMSLNAYDNLPWWLRPEYMYRTKKGAIEFQRFDEKERMLDPGLGSVLQVSPATQTSGVAIGRTLRALHASEVSRWPNDEVFESDVKPSMNALDTFQVFESTGYGRQGLFYEQWCAAEEGENDMRPVFIAVYKVKKYYLPIKGIFELAPDEAAFNERIKKEQHFEISNEFWNFRRVRMRAAKRSGTKAGFLESYPLTPTEAFQSSGLCAFDRDSLEWQSMNKVVKPLWAGEISLVSMEPPRINTDDIAEVKDDEILPRRKSGRGGKRLHVWEWPEKESTYYCLPDGELIRTFDGEKPIEDVSDDDLLLDKDGQWVEITKKMRRLYIGEIVSIRPYGSLEPTRFTTEHPIWISDTLDGERRWVKAKDVKANQWLHYPIPDRTIINGRDLMDKWPEDAVRIDFRIDPAILWNVDFWWIVGLWLGDRWAREKDNMASVEMAFNYKTERWLAEKAQKVIEQMTGRRPRIVQDQSTWKVSWSSVQWARFLHDNFGDRAWNKTIPEWVKRLPREHLSALLQGYFLADGGVVNVNKKGKSNRPLRKKISFVSVSRNLLAGIQDIIFHLGYMGAGGILREAGVTVFPSKKAHATRKTYEICVNFSDTRSLLLEWKIEDTGYRHDPQKIYNHNDGDYVHAKVHKVALSQYEGFVNNFETTTHTYCAGMIATHNCSADVALGNGGDYSSATVYRAGIGMEPDTIVATWLGWIPPKAFAKVLCAIGFFYNGCEIAIEYAKDGITTANEVRDMDYPNLYRPQWKDKIVNQATNYLHWFTNSKTRDEIIGCMNEALLDHTVVIRDADMLDEMIDFASMETGGRSEGQGNEDDQVMSGMIGLYCLRETTKHLKTTVEVEHTRQTGELHVYGVYDNLMRQRGQYNTPGEAEKMILGKAGWRVQPILVCQANTLYSPIFDQAGAEFDLHNRHGLHSTEITPDVVWAYRSAMKNFNPQGAEFGDDW